MYRYARITNPTFWFQNFTIPAWLTLYLIPQFDESEISFGKPFSHQCFFIINTFATQYLFMITEADLCLHVASNYDYPPIQSFISRTFHKAVMQKTYHCSFPSPMRSSIPRFPKTSRRLYLRTSDFLESDTNCKTSSNNYSDSKNEPEWTTPKAVFPADPNNTFSFPQAFRESFRAISATSSDKLNDCNKTSSNSRPKSDKRIAWITKKY